MKKNIADSFQGCLLGVAIGDALGMPAEGFSQAEIEQKFGKITDFVKPPPDGLCSHLNEGQYTDDTQMTIAVAEALIERKGFDPLKIAQKFYQWYLQSDQRGPGFTCREVSSHLMSPSNYKHAAIPSSGCGSAMRVSPIGLLYYKNMKKLAEFAAESSRITHTDVRAVAGAQTVAFAIAYFLRAEEKIKDKDFLTRTASFIEKTSPEFSRKIISLEFFKDYEHLEAMNVIGTSGFVAETVSAAFYAFLKTPGNFSQTVLLGANAGGDTDSIASIAGGLSGAYNGLSGIPQKWVSKVENADYLKELAKKLYDLSKKV